MSDVRAPRVLYLQYTNPGAYPPIENSALILAERGWMVRLLGIRLTGLERLGLRSHPNLDLRLMGSLRRGIRQRVHFVGYCIWAAAQIVAWRPDWVYISDFLAAPVGLFATALRRPCVLYHEHDAPPEKTTSVLVRACIAARRALTLRCHTIVVPGAGRRSAFPPDIRSSDRIMEVWNTPRLSDVPELRQPHPPPLRVLYHGTLVPERLPLHVLDALALLDSEWRLVVVGYETVLNEGHAQRLVDRARSLGCAERLEMLGPVSRSEVFAVAATCHVGLALVPRDTTDLNLTTMPRASCKVFDYLASGAMVLVTDLPAWEGSYVETGVGMACDPGSVDGLASAFRWCASHPDEVAGMGRRGQQLICSEWNYERRFAAVEDRMAGRVGRAPAT